MDSDETTTTGLIATSMVSIIGSPFCHSLMVLFFFAVTIINDLHFDENAVPLAAQPNLSPDDVSIFCRKNVQVMLNT
jgi:hypothetical protein